MPEPKPLNATQQKALDRLVEVQSEFKAAWDAQETYSGHRLTAVARCRDLKISAERMAEATDLSSGRIHQFFMQLDGVKREHVYKPKDADA